MNPPGFLPKLSTTSWMIAGLCAWLFVGAHASAGTRGTALIFGGAGTENEMSGGTLKSAVNVARLAGFDTVVVTDRVSDDVLARARVWIQPGGPNFDQAEDMQQHSIFDQVKAFVAAGGGYVGFCGGGYMAQSYGSLGLGLLPGMATQQDEPVHKTQVMWKGHLRYIHFEYGPKFERAPGVEVFATYVSNGEPAAVRGRYGKGKVVLSGPHPEALPSWEPVGDPDGPDLDLAIDMIQSVAR